MAPSLKEMFCMAGSKIWQSYGKRLVASFPFNNVATEDGSELADGRNYHENQLTERNGEKGGASLPGGPGFGQQILGRIRVRAPAGAIACITWQNGKATQLVEGFEMEPSEIKLRAIAGEIQNETGRAQRTAQPLLSFRDPHTMEKAFNMMREIEEATPTEAREEFTSFLRRLL
jgi:hypothetical protein